jgi:hypothetical protein
MILQLNHGLQELDLSYNEVSSRGALVLAQALECNDYLTSLQVNRSYSHLFCIAQVLTQLQIACALHLIHCTKPACSIHTQIKLVCFSKALITRIVAHSCRCQVYLFYAELLLLFFLAAVMHYTTYTHCS